MSAFSAFSAACCAQTSSHDVGIPERAARSGSESGGLVMHHLALAQGDAEHAGKVGLLGDVLDIGDQDVHGGGQVAQGAKDLHGGVATPASDFLEHDKEVDVAVGSSSPRATEPNRTIWAGANPSTIRATAKGTHSDSQRPS